jgi:hypothetical protein
VGLRSREVPCGAARRASTRANATRPGSNARSRHCDDLAALIAKTNALAEPAEEASSRAEYPLSMIMRLVTLSISLLCVFGPVGVRADDSSVRAALQARYAAMETAMTERNSKAIAALLAPDFISIDSSGRVRMRRK